MILRRGPAPQGIQSIASGHMDDPTSETTELLRAWADGDRGALERLTPHVYRTLRRIAGRQLQNDRAGQTLQATALVHEAWLELIDITNVDWQHRAHFFAISAQIMRHILLDRARRRMRAKRGGHAERVNLDALPDVGGSRARELIVRLNALAEIDPRKARVIELRFFGGLSVEETAEVLAVSLKPSCGTGSSPDRGFTPNSAGAEQPVQKNL